jgi:hypothetical protein
MYQKRSRVQRLLKPTPRSNTATSSGFVSFSDLCSCLVPFLLCLVYHFVWLVYVLLWRLPNFFWAVPNPKQIRMQIRPEYLTDIQNNRNGAHSWQMDGQCSRNVVYYCVMWSLNWAVAVFGRRPTDFSLENMQRWRLWGTLVRRSSKMTLLQGKYRHELSLCLLQDKDFTLRDDTFSTAEFTVSIQILCANLQ